MFAKKYLLLFLFFPFCLDASSKLYFKKAGMIDVTYGKKSIRLRRLNAKKLSKKPQLLSHILADKDNMFQQHFNRNQLENRNSQCRETESGSVNSGKPDWQQVDTSNYSGSAGCLKPQTVSTYPKVNIASLNDRQKELEEEMANEALNREFCRMLVPTIGACVIVVGYACAFIYANQNESGK